jgi:hypothetical protein
MLKPQDIEITTYTGPQGSSVKVLHKPTGIFRGKGPPIKSPGKLQREALREIETELVERGLAQYLLPRPK